MSRNFFRHLFSFLLPFGVFLFVAIPIFAACSNTAACTTSGNSDLTGTCCNNDYCSIKPGIPPLPGSCVSRASQGQSCTGSSYTPQGTCTSGLICTGEQVYPTEKPGTCQPAGSAGASCTTNGNNIQGTCSNNYWCYIADPANPSQQGTCKLRSSFGQSCIDSQYSPQGTCQTNLVCTGESVYPTEKPGTCKNAGKVGDTCTGSQYSPQGSCQNGLYCINETIYPTEKPGTCSKTPGNTPTPTAAPPPPPCIKDSKGNCVSVDSAFGQISIDPPAAIAAIFGILLSFSGGIALLLIVFSGYRIMTSQGDQEKLKGAREMLTSAIIGLLFIIFSVTILRVIGVDIFHIPGFLFR